MGTKQQDISQVSRVFRAVPNFGNGFADGHIDDLRFWIGENLSEADMTELFDSYVIVESATINLTSSFGLNSTKAIIQGFNSSTIKDTEFLQINYTVSTNFDVDTVTLNFTGGGTNSCSLGNLQDIVCYNFTNSHFKYIEFVNDSLTSTFDSRAGTGVGVGDNIVESRVGSLQLFNVSFEIDEHFNPNVYKHYGALFNFSVIKWQQGTDQRISKDNLIKVHLNTSLVPLNADIYKLDVRINTTGSPIQALDSYLCNSSYTAGSPSTTNSCVLVGSQFQSDFQDDGTKMRVLFTKANLNGIGDLGFVVLDSDEPSASKYYSIQTYNATNPSYITHWEFSVNDGTNYSNLGDGFETELNINWYFASPNTTVLHLNLCVNSTTDGALFCETNNVTWSVDLLHNIEPVVSLISPTINESINLPFNITFFTSDPNGDNLNVSLLLLNLDGTLNETIITGMNQSNTSFVWNSSINGSFNLVLLGTELSTSELFSRNDTHSINITTKAVFMSVDPDTLRRVHSLTNFPYTELGVTNVVTTTLFVNGVQNNLSALTLYTNESATNFTWNPAPKTYTIGIIFSNIADHTLNIVGFTGETANVSLFNDSFTYFARNFYNVTVQLFENINVTDSYYNQNAFVFIEKDTIQTRSSQRNIDNTMKWVTLFTDWFHKKTGFNQSVQRTLGNDVLAYPYIDGLARVRVPNESVDWTYHLANAESSIQWTFGSRGTNFEPPITRDLGGLTQIELFSARFDTDQTIKIWIPESDLRFKDTAYKKIIIFMLILSGIAFLVVTFIVTNHDMEMLVKTFVALIVAIPILSIALVGIVNAL